MGFTKKDLDRHVARWHDEEKKKKVRDYAEEGKRERKKHAELTGRGKTTAASLTPGQIDQVLAHYLGESLVEEPQEYERMNTKELCVALSDLVREGYLRLEKTPELQYLRDWAVKQEKKFRAGVSLAVEVPALENDES